MRALLVAVCLALPATALAEPLAGTVLDGETLQPIAGAEVRIDEVEVATTDVNGGFSFAEVPAGRLEVIIRAQGYAESTEVVELGRGGITDQVFVLFAADSEVFGETIQIEAVNREPPPPGKQELSRRELTRIPGSRGDALTSIKTLPGVAAVDAPGSGPGLLVIRGSAPEDSVVLLDGVEVPLLYHFFGLQSILPSEFIETIDFAPGGFGAEKGRSTGGVIEINTRNKVIEQWSGFAELSFINFAGLVQGPLWEEKDLQISAAMRRSAIDLILPAVIPDDTDINFTTAPQYYDGQLRVDWLPDSPHRVSVLGLASLDLLTLINDTINPNEPELTGKFDNETSFTRAITTWAYEGKKLSNRLVSSLGTAAFRFEIGAERFLRLSNFRAELRDDVRYRVSQRLQLRAGAEGRLSTTSLEARIPLPPGEGDGDQDNFSTRPLVVRDETVSNNLAAAYAAADLEVTEAMTVTSGVRLDYYDRLGEATVGPRLSLRYKPEAAPWTARLALGSYSRPLQQVEGFQTNLSPEIATQYVLGGDYELGGGFELSSSLFYTDRRRLVVLDPALNMTDPANAYINRGTGSSYGIEALLRTRRDNFFGWIAYTLSRSERVDNPVDDQRLFDFDQTHNFLIVGSYRWNKWELAGRWQLVTGVPDTPVIGSVYLADANIYIPVYGETNSERFPTAHQLDIRVDRTWKLDHVELSAYLDVTNVYANPKTLGFFYNFNFTEREAVEELPLVPAIGIRGTF
jgi:outer membrane receptor protein involved in Fe transport